MKKKLLPDYLLFCPGPVNVAQNIWSSIVREIGHREEEFSLLLESVSEKILTVFEVRHKDKYFPVFITGSGTAANEAVLSSIVGDKHILILTNGEFGERLHNISRLHNKNTHLIDFAWGSKMDIVKIEKYIQENPIDIIAMVHNETSVGMLNPIIKVGRIAKKYKKIFFVDAVSSAVAEEVNLEKANITFCSTASGKAVGSLPGIGIIIGKRTSFENLKELRAKTAYLNLYNLYLYSAKHRQTPNTPAVQLFFALEQALSNILKIGIAERRARFSSSAKLLREGMKELGLKLLIDEKIMSSIVTTVVAPSFLPVSVLKEKLKRKGIVIYSGKGPLLDKVFQVGNMGELNDLFIKYFLKCLEEIIFKYSKGNKIHQHSFSYAKF